MKKIWRIFKGLLLVALGAGLALGLGQCVKNTFPSNWFTIEQPPRLRPQMGAFEEYGGRIALTTDILTKAEKKNAVLPEVVALYGRAKFLTSGERSDASQVPIGYEIKLTLASKKQLAESIDRSKQSNEKTSDKPFRFPDRATFTVNFILKDEDGFVLQEVQSETHYTDRGTTEALKGITKESIGTKIGSATKTMECQVVFSDMFFEEDVLNFGDLSDPSDKP